MAGRVQLNASPIVINQFDYMLAEDGATVMDENRVKEGYMCHVINRSNRDIVAYLETDKQVQRIVLPRYKNSISYFFEKIPRLRYEFFKEKNRFPAYRRRITD